MFKRKKKNKNIALIAFALAFLIWGVNGVFVKVSVDALPVPLFLFIRFSVAAAILLPFTVKKYKKLKPAVWGRIIVSTLVGISGFMLLMGYALQRTSALETAFIFLLGPIFMFILSIEVLREKFNAKILVGLIVALAGAAVVIASPLLQGITGITATGSFKGNSLMVLAVLISVLGTIIIKPALKKAPAMQITTSRFIIAAISLVPVLILTDIPYSSISWTPEVIAAVVFNILFGSVVAYSIYHWALNRISGEESSVLHYLDPLAGVLAAIFILGDQLTPVILLGGGLTVIGVLLSEARPKLKHHHFHSHR